MVRLSIDRLARETASEVRAHAAAFGTLTAAFVFLPGLAFGLLSPNDAAAFRVPAPGQLPHFPPWFWPSLLVGVILQSLVQLTIAAIAADPARPAHETVGRTLARMMPALARYLGALLLLFVGYLLLSIPIGLLIAIVGGAARMAGGGDPAGAARSMQALLGLVLLALVPVLLWVAARLSPLTGVFAVEGAAPTGGIRRAWALSRGSGLKIAFLIVILSFAAILAAVSVQGLAAAFGATASVAGAPGLGTLLVKCASSAVSAVLFVYFAAGLGVLYRQLRAN